MDRDYFEVDHPAVSVPPEARFRGYKYGRDGKVGAAAVGECIAVSTAAAARAHA